MRPPPVTAPISRMKMARRDSDMSTPPAVLLALLRTWGLTGGAIAMAWVICSVYMKGTPWMMGRQAASGKLVEDDEGGNLGAGVLQGDGFFEPGLAVDALDHAPSHLVLEEVDVRAGGDLDLHAVADDVELRVDEDEVALGAQGRQLFGDERGQAEQLPHRALDRPL